MSLGRVAGGHGENRRAENTGGIPIGPCAGSGDFGDFGRNRESELLRILCLGRRKS
jgi:hypothetical protein